MSRPTKLKSRTEFGAKLLAVQFFGVQNINYRNRHDFN